MVSTGPHRPCTIRVIYMKKNYMCCAFKQVSLLIIDFPMAHIMNPDAGCKCVIPFFAWYGFAKWSICFTQNKHCPVTPSFAIFFIKLDECAVLAIRSQLGLKWRCHVYSVYHQRTNLVRTRWHHSLANTMTRMYNMKVMMRIPKASFIDWGREKCPY